MAIQGFNKSFYLGAKLKQLKNDPNTAAEWDGKTVADLETLLQDDFGLTAEQHYEQYGYQESLAPNALFNPAEYIRAKAEQMVETDDDYDNVDAAAADFVEIWNGNVYQHYLQYGEAENVNPSNDFDVSDYLAAKLAQLQADDDTSAEWADKDVSDVAAAFEDSGLTALEHFLAYGRDEGLSAPAVPADEQVEVDDDNGDTDPGVPGETFDLTVGADNLEGTADNDIFNAGIGQNANGQIVNTLSSADKIDGGAGNDTLNASLSTEVNLAGDALNVQPTTRDVETINIEARSSRADNEANNAGTVNLDAKNMVGVDTFGSDYSDGDLVIQNVNTLDGNGGIRNTGDMTVRMDHTSNFNSIGDASDLTVLFDDDYLISGEETKTNLQLRIVNTYELAENESPLTDFESVDFTVGGEDVSVDLTGVETYQDVADAINAELNNLGISGVTASTAESRTAVFTDDVGGYVQGETAGSYLPVDIVSTAGDLEPGTIKRASDVADFDGLNTWISGDPETNEDPVSINVELEKVGRAGEGGNLIIGGKDGSQAQGSGIQVFDIEVQGDASQPSNLGTITSTNDTLETVNIVTDPSRAGTDDLADLTVRGEVDAQTEQATGAFGGIDGQADTYIDMVDASGFEGNLTLGSDVAVQNLGTLNATGGGDVTFNGNYTDEASHVVETGAGDDLINLTGDGNATITTGEGDDTIIGRGVSIDVDGGAGNDAIYVDNSGNMGSAEVTTEGLKQAVGGEDPNYGLLFDRTVTVTVNGDQGVNDALAEALVNGFEGTAKVAANNVDGASRLTNQDDLNDAVIKAVADSSVLSDLVEVEVNSDGELQFTSKIDGDNISVEIGVGKSNWSTNDLNTLESEYQAANNDSGLTFDSMDKISATGVNLDGGADSGSASGLSNDNVVHLSGGEDTIVLSTSGGTDTIVFDESFGTSSIVNFTAGEDQLDFSAYLDSMKSDSGSVTSQVRIDTNYTVDNDDTTLSANEVNIQDFGGNSTATFAGLTADNLLSVFGFDTENYTNTNTNTQLVDGNGSAIIMVQNADNAGEYKVFDVSFNGTDGDTSLSAGDIELIGTADFGATVDFTAANIA